MLFNARFLKRVALNIDRISRRLDPVLTAGIDLEPVSRSLLTIEKIR